MTWPLAERHAREVKVEHRGPSGKHVLRVQIAPGESSKGSGGQLKAWTGVKLVTGKTDLERGVGDGPSQRRANERGWNGALEPIEEACDGVRGPPIVQFASIDSENII